MYTFNINFQVLFYILIFNRKSRINAPIDSIGSIHEACLNFGNIGLHIQKTTMNRKSEYPVFILKRLQCIKKVSILSEYHEEKKIQRSAVSRSMLAYRARGDYRLQSLRVPLAFQKKARGCVHKLFAA